MKVLLVGDAGISTGFANCNHAVCDALHAAGHQVAVLALNWQGDPWPPYPYPLFPCRNVFENARDGFGVARLPRLVERLNPDIVVITQDSWNFAPYLDELAARLPEGRTVPVVGWVAVDGMNQKAAPDLNRLLHVAVWTEFAKRELQSSGCTAPISIVPLGVDHAVYHPLDRSASRARILPEDTVADVGDRFLVGAVGRNQLRKRLDLTIEYFAEWVHTRRVEDAFLYLHCAPTGEDGADIESLTAFHDLKKRVIVARSITPGAGAPVDYMAAVYSALDVYVSTSQGEGWGLPALEAMACGVPCILPDFAAFGHQGWVSHSAIRIPCSTHLLTAPLNTAMYTIGAVPNRKDFVNELDGVYGSHFQRRTYAKRGLETAARYSWASTGQAFVALLEKLHTEIAPPAKPIAPPVLLSEPDREIPDEVQQC
jgi:glycosyltransferase involved in cell wall biosynthesis